MAYIGANGSGKSAMMVHDTLPSLNAGRTVYSTVRLLDPITGDPHPSYVPLKDWNQLLNAQHCDVLLDEVTGVASSRESSSLPPQVANLLVQLRRRDIVLRWTAPAWARADKIIRECTQAVTVSKGYISGRSKESRLWRPKQLFRVKTYDAFAYDQVSQGQLEKASSTIRSWWWGPGSAAFASYDTLDQVERISTLDQYGICITCNGTRRRPACSCDH